MDHLLAHVSPLAPRPQGAARSAVPVVIGIALLSEFICLRMGTDSGSLELSGVDGHGGCSGYDIYNYIRRGSGA